MAQQVDLGAHGAEQIIEEVPTAVEAVAAAMYRLLPHGFPGDVADTILEGMLGQCAKLLAMPQG
jgi:serine/threonine-protein kinase HipA